MQRSIKEIMVIQQPMDSILHIVDIMMSWDHVAELRDLGVQIVIGKAAFLDAHRVEVAGANGDAVAGAAAPLVIEADSIVVASGSVAMFPPGLEPDGNRIIAPKLALKLEGLPSSIALVGAGVTGTEFVYAFNRLGVAVTWLVDEYGVLPPFERDTTAELVAALEGRGVERHEGIAVQSVVADEEGVTSTLRDGRSFRTDMAFIAIGRRPDVAGLNLEAAGLPMDARLGIEVDEFSRSSVPGIYAAGDVTGMPMTANKALAQGWIAGWHAAGAAVSPYRPETVISAVYSDPQVAQVGLTEEEAGREGRKVEVHRLGYESGLKPLLMDETRGFVKLVADDGDGTILGASAVGAHAANLLAPIALGIRLGARLEDLAAIFAAYPGLSELPFAAARSAALESD